ncbi:hypothetical protein EU508_09905 [Pseudoalteromonas fuliginea]|uniref:SAM-dependent methyltransferase n=1 Tax=Pseudoalteromonas fuliginea TaxID=1872678 RepID=A0AB73BHA8_9GAMM|nr:hypothetical protein [Pseudoalteromonas fuliginea]KAA1160753.1 hypothetical protein EU508_09905 [Pseudoalteromonas fuliginea]
MRQLKNDTIEANQIKSEQTDFGPITVFQNQQYRWLTLAQKKDEDITIQGVMCLVHPEQVIVPVNQCMLLFLLKPVNTLNILNLGLGTAGFERIMYHLQNHTPYINIINTFSTIEINPNIASIATQLFNLPSNHNIHLQCAEQYISKCTANFNVITIDIFSGEHHQPFLTNDSFWQNINRCSEPNTQVIVNLNPQTGQELQALLVLIRQHFKCLALIEFNEYKNIVLILCQHTLMHINVDEIQNSPVFINFAPDLYKSINNIYHIE